MDGIVDLVLGEEPHFVSPLFRVAICILGVIVIDQVCVPDVPVKSRVERRIRQKLGQGHCDNGVGRRGTAFESVLISKGWILCSVLYVEEAFCLFCPGQTFVLLESPWRRPRVVT